MASSTVTVSGWTSLGTGPMVIECNNPCGVWLIDAATQPDAGVLRGTIYLEAGKEFYQSPQNTLWALPGQGAATASVGVEPQAAPGGAGYAASGVAPVTATLSSGTTTSGEFVPLAGRLFSVDVASGVTVQLQRYSDAAASWLPATSTTWAGPVAKDWQSDRVGARFRFSWVSGSGPVGFAQ